MDSERGIQIHRPWRLFEIMRLSTGRILTLPPGAPVSDPASVEKLPRTRRIGVRRSTTPVDSGAVSRCAPSNIQPGAS